MSDKSRSAHWHEGWFSLSFIFILLVTALSYPVLLAQGWGYELSMVMVLLIFIVLVVITVSLFAGLKTNQELHKRGVYDRARKSGKRLKDHVRKGRENRKTRKAQKKGGNKEG